MPVMQPQTYGAVAYPSSFEPDHSGHGTHLFQQQPVQAAAVLQSSASRVQFEPPRTAYIMAPQPPKLNELEQPSALRPNQALLATIRDYRHPSNRDKRWRCVAATGAIVSGVLLVLAIAAHQLAKGTAYGLSMECTIDRVQVADLSNATEPDELHDAYYAKYCFDHDDDDERFDVNDWCDTFRGAMIWLGCVAFSALFICCGTCIVQPICTVQRCCCPNACPRVVFVFAMILAIVANVEWIVNDKVCLNENGLHLQIGNSIYLVTACCVLLFLVICCAK
mmetsp:Transcript_43175/g.71327  ORF Transcript_43175/g.71327 Transcript_43175/m.71327 type:complete len:279 (+) Transcript_43175:703-1539(+)